MHELSLATEIFDLVESNMPNGSELMAVHLRVGPLAGVCNDSLTFCFDELARQIGFPDAELHIINTKVECECSECSAIYAVESVQEPCPNCSSLRRMIHSGKEFQVISIDVEEMQHV